MFLGIFGPVSSFELRGIWSGNLTDYRKFNIPYTLKVRPEGVRLVGTFYSNGTHKMMPNQILIRELNADKRYAINVPSRKQPNFADLRFSNQTDRNIFISKANSSDKIWSIDVEVAPTQSIHVHIINNEKPQQWFDFSMKREEQKSLMVPILIIVAIITFGVILGLVQIFCVDSKEMKSAQKKKME